jgi:peptide/nickel transport system permease protein
VSKLHVPNTGLDAHPRRDPVLALAMALLFLVCFVAVLAPLLDAHGALQKDIMGGLTPLGAPLPPSRQFPLGTDMLGRCEASRVLLGARLSLRIAVPAALIAVGIGTLVGILAGYFAGLADRALMRLVDAFLAFPFLLLILALAAVFRESEASSAPVLLVRAISGWTTTARVVRSKVLTLRELDFIVAARALGARHPSILFRHILPNLTGTILVMMTLVLADMLLAEATLSFLGLGAPPPMPSWGRMLSEGQMYLQGAPWLIFAPGTAILVTVLGCNLLGERLRSILDPRDQRSRAREGTAV